MTDLETACRDLVAEWKESELEQPLNHAELAEKDAFEYCISGLEDALEEHTDPEVKALVEQMEAAT